MSVQGRRNIERSLKVPCEPRESYFRTLSPAADRGLARNMYFRCMLFNGMFWCELLYILQKEEHGAIYLLIALYNACVCLVSMKG